MQSAGRTLRCSCGAYSQRQPVRWPQQGAGQEPRREPGRRRALVTCLLPCILLVQIPRRFIYWDLMGLFCHCFGQLKMSSYTRKAAGANTWTCTSLFKQTTSQGSLRLAREKGERSRLYFSVTINPRLCSSNLLVINDLHVFYMQSTLTLQQNFHPIMKSSSNLRPGSCHLNQVQDAMTSPLAERIWGGGVALIYFQILFEGLTHVLTYLYCECPGVSPWVWCLQLRSFSFLKPFCGVQKQGIIIKKNHFI